MIKFIARNCKIFVLFTFMALMDPNQKIVVFIKKISLSDKLKIFEKFGKFHHQKNLKDLSLNTS